MRIVFGWVVHTHFNPDVKWPKSISIICTVHISQSLCKLVIHTAPKKVCTFLQSSTVKTKEKLASG